MWLVVWIGVFYAVYADSLVVAVLCVGGFVYRGLRPSSGRIVEAWRSVRASQEVSKVGREDVR